MDVSVIIINYNTFQLTCNCIQSVIDKTKDVSYEIILVDNGSSEIDPEEFIFRFPNIKLIKSAENVGFAKGNNLGITSSSGQYLLLLNSDTVLKGNALFAGKEFLESHSSVAAVSGRLEFANGTVQHNCQRFPSIRYKMFEFLRIQKFVSRSLGGRILLGSFFKYDTVVYPDWIWGTFFMLKKELLTLLPEKRLADIFFMYGEDMQWCMEFRKLGFGVAFTPEVSVVHFMGMSNAPKQKMIDENNRIFMEQYYSSLHRKLIYLLDRILKIKFR